MSEMIGAVKIDRPESRIDAPIITMSAPAATVQCRAEPCSRGFCGASVFDIESRPLVKGRAARERATPLPLVGQRVIKVNAPSRPRGRVRRAQAFPGSRGLNPCARDNSEAGIVHPSKYVALPLPRVDADRAEAAREPPLLRRSRGAPQSSTIEAHRRSTP